MKCDPIVTEALERAYEAVEAVGETVLGAYLEGSRRLRTNLPDSDIDLSVVTLPALDDVLLNERLRNRVVHINLPHTSVSCDALMRPLPTLARALIAGDERAVTGLGLAGDPVMCAPKRHRDMRLVIDLAKSAITSHATARALRGFAENKLEGYERLVDTDPTQAAKLAVTAHAVAAILERATWGQVPPAASDEIAHAYATARTGDRSVAKALAKAARTRLDCICDPSDDPDRARKLRHEAATVVRKIYGLA